MKRLFFLLFLSLFMGMNSKAQNQDNANGKLPIQTKILDFVIGVTTSDEVKNYCNSNPDKEWEEDKTDNSISVTDLRFGGCYWDITFFSFHKGVLTDVNFMAIDTENVSKAEIKSNWEKLKRNLTKKYASYLVKELSKEDLLFFTDDKTAIFLQISNKDSRRTLDLTYKDVQLTFTQQEDEEGEL